MKQQLLFAEAVISDADILILDEPFNGLDPSYSIQFKKVLKKIKRCRENNYHLFPYLSRFGGTSR